jgi:hypothetical protein
VEEVDDADSVDVDAVVENVTTASGRTLRDPPRLRVTGYSITRRGGDDVKELHIEAPEEMPNRSSSEEGHEVAMCRIFLFFDVTPPAMMILSSSFLHFMASIISL